MKNNTRKNGMEQEIFERQAAICKAFANATRIHMLDLLGKRECGASELQQELGISKANLSQHLSILRSAGVVVTRRNGKQILCSLAIPEVKQACQLIRNVLRAQIRDTRKLLQ
jgi:DNA-binding transcriptional ArsR family regulator